MRDGDSAKGFIFRLFGVVLIIVGALDSLLSWRGGFAVSEAYVILIASGVVLYAVGAIRRESRSRHEPIHSMSGSEKPRCKRSPT